jgi:hypothetical protein
MKAMLDAINKDAILITVSINADNAKKLAQNHSLSNQHAQDSASTNPSLFNLQILDVPAKNAKSDTLTVSYVSP